MVLRRGAGFCAVRSWMLALSWRRPSGWGYCHDPCSLSPVSVLSVLSCVACSRRSGWGHPLLSLPANCPHLSPHLFLVYCHPF
ncbi:hypothetical protein UPYG_G00060270 [Umbra pygmaea]|uniref:Secreted protein n=1 Tax=Umbra pygmaea TaxID=75934 RepID=A0ABD0X9F1_UMBPY